MSQDALMRFDPATGEERPHPSHAEQWRKFHGYGTAWLFNPWNGKRRDARSVGSDVLGRLIVPEDEPLRPYSTAEINALQANMKLERQKDKP